MFKRLITGISSLLLLIACSIVPQSVFAESSDDTYGIGMSPLSEKISLKPGDSYTGSFKIHNVSDKQDFGYSVTINPYYVDENYNNLFNVENSFVQITDWTTLNKNSGVLSASGETTIIYTINVPENAPAGGQYMAIMVTSDDSLLRAGQQASVGIVAKQAMAFLVYAEISGTTVRSGEIIDYSVPGFLLSGKITGTSSIKNSGNVHGAATYKLQVFPLFSDEEIYTNEEEPQVATILPERTLLNTTSWDETPAAGIFNVVYIAEFEDEKIEVQKLVIVCPIWLLLTLFFAVIFALLWLASKSKSRKKTHKKIRR